MALFSIGKTARELRALRSDNDDLRRRNSELEGFVGNQTTPATGSYTSNRYTTYANTIAEIAAKYQAASKWGCVQTGNIIDTRAAFIIGQGLSLSPVADAAGETPDKESNEMRFARDFLAYNGLDREMVQDLAKEAEIEGCFLGALKWIPEDKQVSLRFVSRVEAKYKIEHPPDDYLWYQRAKWSEGSSPVGLEEDHFVYARFGGRIHKPNEPMPKIGKCLDAIEGLSQALRDWREINRLFGAPVPHIQCATPADVTYMRTSAKEQAENWRTRKLFMHTGQLSFLFPDPGAQQGIEKEITTLAKIISGTTGCPISFLGFGELVTKLGSGSEVTSDQVEAATSKERVIWVGVYQEILEKAMAIYSQESRMTPLIPARVRVSIPRVSPETWKRIMETWLPVYNSGAISLQTLLAQIPGVDAADEMERVAAEKEQNMERFNRGRAGRDDEDDENDDEEEA